MPWPCQRSSIDRPNSHGRDQAEAVGFADMDEMIELGLRQFADGAEEAIVAGANRERPEVTLQRIRITRLDETNHQRFAAAQPQDIGMLPEVVETKRNHRRLPLVPKRRWPASPKRSDAGAHDPPKRWRFGDKIHAPFENLERDRTQNRIPLLLVALPA